MGWAAGSLALVVRSRRTLPLLSALLNQLRGSHLGPANAALTAGADHPVLPEAHKNAGARPVAIRAAHRSFVASHLRPPRSHRSSSTFPLSGGQKAYQTGVLCVIHCIQASYKVGWPVRAARPRGGCYQSVTKVGTVTRCGFGCGGCQLSTRLTRGSSPKRRARASR